MCVSQYYFTKLEIKDCAEHLTSVALPTSKLREQALMVYLIHHYPNTPLPEYLEITELSTGACECYADGVDSFIASDIRETIERACAYRKRKADCLKWSELK